MATPGNNLLPNSSGGRIPPFDKSDLFKTRKANRALMRINALWNIIIARGSQDRVDYADQNVTITLRDTTAASGVDQPSTHPVERFKIVTPEGAAVGDPFNFDNYICCRTWDGTTLGDADVYVAKPTFIQNSIVSEAYRGVTKAFAYAYNGTAGFKDYTRTTTASGRDPETSIVEPPYLLGGILLAADMTNSDSGGTGVTRPNPVPGQPALDVVWQEITARWWQAVPVDPPP